jgi:pimeloyl-ACP methyl ester carboxylesterase
MPDRSPKPVAWLAVPALAAGVLGILYRASEQAILQTEAKYPPLGRFLTVYGVPLHYLERGAGAPVVLIHGSGGVLQDFSMSILDRVAAQYRAVVFDRPGHGYSGRPADQPLTLDTNALLIHGAVRQLELEKPLMVGHAFGASVALQYALKYPDDIAALVLLSPSAYAQGASVHPLFRLPTIPLLGPLVLNTLLVPLADRVARPLNERAFHPDPLPDEYHAVMLGLSARPEQFRAFAEENRLAGEGLAAISPRYGEIRPPVVIVAGDSDLQTPLESQARPLHAALPGSVLIELPGTGHEVHHKHPQVVMNAIAQAWELAGQPAAVAPVSDALPPAG